MTRWTALACLAAIVPLAGCNPGPASLAQPVPMPQTLPSVSAQDQQFLNQAFSSNIFEVRSAALALDRTRNPRTRRFAEMLAESHDEIGHRLQALARANGVPLPTDLGPEEQRAYAALENTQRIFDSEFFRQQAFAHRTAIALYRNEAANGTNPDIRRFAQDSVPALQQHLQIAEAGREMPMGRIPAAPVP